MKILSLFDGMACGMIAMLNAGIEVESYDAYEIDKYAIKVDGSIYLVNDNGENIPVYLVKNGMIYIKGKGYSIKLTDGYYIIRKLTVMECMRLQTVPGWHDFSVISNSQAYKCLGNGWTCDVITHLINATQKASRRKWLDDLLGDCL